MKKIISAYSAPANGVNRHTQTFDNGHVVSFLNQLQHGSVNGVTEIRCLFDNPVKINDNWTGKTVSGYYDPEHYEQAASDIEALDGKANIYVTLNPVNPDLMARASNRLQFNSKHTTKDSDIISRLWLPVDIDPVRPSGISSTDSELEAAIIVRDEIASEFHGYGFEQLTGISGNGAHCLIRIDEKKDSDSVAKVLSELSRAYSTESVNVDTSVSNASRIWKCYGTLAVKGDNTALRPHRRAYLDEGTPTATAMPLSLFPLFDIVADPTISANPNSNSVEHPTENQWIEASIQRTKDKMASANEGQKHQMLLRAAINLGGFPVSDERIESELMDALGGRSKSESGSLKTIRDGIAQGRNRPHTIPTATKQAKSTLNGAQLPQGKTDESKEQWTYTPREALRNREHPDWLIDQLIIEKTAIVLSGDSEGFKTFCALDMALCVALGREWQGRQTKQGTVIYIAAEGGWTLSDRLDAWEIANNTTITDDKFKLLEVPVAFDSAEVVLRFSEFIKSERPALVIIDTLSTCNFTLNESLTEDMALFIRNMKTVSEETGAATMVIHHNNKMGIVRGSIALINNPDTHISFQRSKNESDEITVLSCLKQRVKKFDAFALHGVEIEVNRIDKQGRVATSLVLEPCEMPERNTSERKPNKNAAIASNTKERILEALDELLIKSPDGVRVGIWQKRTEELGLGVDRTFYRHLARLLEAKEIEEILLPDGSKTYCSS